MAVKEILKWPSPALAKKSRPVAGCVSSDIVKDMIDTMAHCNGIGLAAPQIGLNQRIVVLDINTISSVEGSSIDDEKILVMVNPEIIDGMGELMFQESCLSIPGETFNTLRSPYVFVKYDNRNGESVEKTFSGLAAISIQHEIEHLDGITLADRASIEKRREILSSLG
tara:strand:+ start:315 stop:818 length:504 start_codon:yes stop_codon:yes gene_type:complete